MFPNNLLDECVGYVCSCFSGLQLFALVFLSMDVFDVRSNTCRPELPVDCQF